MATYRKSELLAIVESSGMNAQTCLVFNMLAMRLHEGIYGVKNDVEVRISEYVRN